MSYLSEEFNVPESTIKKMITKGVISCAWVGRDEIISLHKQGKTLSEIASITCRPRSTVHWIISLSKKS